MDARSVQAARGAAEVQALIRTIRDVDAGGFGASDLGNALRRAQDAIKAKQVDDHHRPELGGYITQAQQRVGKVAGAGESLISELAHAIRAYDRGEGRERLNTALAGTLRPGAARLRPGREARATCAPSPR